MRCDISLTFRLLVQKFIQASNKETIKAIIIDP